MSECPILGRIWGSVGLDDFLIWWGSMTKAWEYPVVPNFSHALEWKDPLVITCIIPDIPDSIGLGRKKIPCSNWKCFFIYTTPLNYPSCNYSKIYRVQCILYSTIFSSVEAAYRRDAKVSHSSIFYSSLARRMDALGIADSRPPPPTAPQYMCTLSFNHYWLGSESCPGEKNHVNFWTGKVTLLVEKIMF